jgi:hypothetical protein
VGNDDYGTNSMRELGFQRIVCVEMRLDEFTFHINRNPSRSKSVAG